MGCTTHAGFQSSEKQWIEGPRHVLLHLQLHKQQKKIVHDIVMPTVKRSAWHAYIWWDDNTIPSLFMAIRRGEQWREQQSTETKGTKHWTHCKQHCGSHWLVGSSWALSDIYNIYHSAPSRSKVSWMNLCWCLNCLAIQNQLKDLSTRSQKCLGLLAATRSENVLEGLRRWAT